MTPKRWLMDKTIQSFLTFREDDMKALVIDDCETREDVEELGELAHKIQKRAAELETACGAELRELDKYHDGEKPE